MIASTALMCQGKEDIKIKPLKQKEWLYFFCTFLSYQGFLGKWCICGVKRNHIKYNQSENGLNIRFFAI
jgi:hypothetical protein